VGTGCTGGAAEGADKARLGGVTAGGGVDEDEAARGELALVFYRKPRSLEVAPDPRAQALGGVFADQPCACVLDRDRAERCARGLEIGAGGAVGGEIDPPDVQVSIVAAADEARDVEIRAGEVGAGVEEIVEIAAREGVEGVVGVEAGELGGIAGGESILEGLQGREADVGEAVEDAAGGAQLVFTIGKGGALAEVAIDDGDVGEAAVAGGAAKPLDEGGPRGELGDKGGGADVDASLDDLRGDEDPVDAGFTCLAV
jgi:hypothetical protein